MRGLILVFLLFLPAIVWHFFILNVGAAALLATASMGLLVAAMNWTGSWTGMLGNFLGGCLVGLGPALFVGLLYHKLGGKERLEYNDRALASGGRRRETIGAIGGLSIGLAMFASFGSEATPRALLGAAAFLAIGLCTLIWLYLTRKPRDK